MTDAAARSCEYDVTPEAALKAINADEGPLLVDFDETLYLRNSTEDFLSCAKPMWLAALVLRLLDALKPWILTGRDTQDNWRVGVISLLFPWTRWRWKARLPFLAERYTNAELAALLKARPEAPVVVTAGFSFIVSPLLAAMGFEHAPLVAMRVRVFADRRDGKLRMAERMLGREAVARSLVVTDSAADLELMHACRTSLRARWPGARYERALSGVYLPGDYISRVKRPGERHIFRSVLQEDFAFWLLSSIGLAPYAVPHVIGLLLLLISFWTIYELGYVDNDWIAARYETDPKLNAAFWTETVGKSSIQPWIWAMVSGAAGVAVLSPERTPLVIHFAVWMTVLVLVYFCFASYNRLDKQTRVWLYPILQFARSASFAVVVPIEPAGAAALSAHVVSRWLPYLVYRQTASQWPETRTALVRLVAFILFLAILESALGLSGILTWSALALLAWNVFKARRDLYQVIASARRIDSLAAPRGTPPAGLLPTAREVGDAS